MLGRHDSPEAVTVIAFSPDGRWMASGSDDASIMIWPVEIDSLFAAACRTVGRSMSPEEWREYLQNKPYRDLCSQ